MTVDPNLNVGNFSIYVPHVRTWTKKQFIETYKNHPEVTFDLDNIWLRIQERLSELFPEKPFQEKLSGTLKKKDASTPADSKKRSKD